MRKYQRREHYLVYGSPQIEQAEIDEVVDSLKSGWIGTGPKVFRFEQMMAKYVNATAAVALNSCTAALHLSMVAAGIGPGDEVITTPMTFAATANVILHTRARPVFVDIDPHTMLIDPTKIASAITDKTRAILPVHFAGRPCNMNAIRDIATKHSLLIIEDAAHAIEAVYYGEKIGSIGDMTCFSFYVTKNVVTGEGGMVTTNNNELADKIKVYGLHGMTQDAWKRFSDNGYKHYQVVFPGYKYNMMDMQAAIGIHQLKRVEKNWLRRDEIWHRYNEAFSDLPFEVPAPDELNTRHARHLYTILIDPVKSGKTRDQVLDLLHQENIGTGVHYTSLHLHPLYRKQFGYKIGDFPFTEYVGKRTLSLPFSAKLSDKDVEDVINAICFIFR